MYQIRESSKEISREKSKYGPKGYPWNELEIGQSFVIPAGQVLYTSIYAYAWKRGRTLKKKFFVKELISGEMEIARIK